LIVQLLQRDPNKRMCSGPSGSDEIQTHEFFNLVDWKKLMVKDVKPIYKPSENTSFGELKDAEEPQGKILQVWIHSIITPNLLQI